MNEGPDTGPPLTPAQRLGLAAVAAVVVVAYLPALSIGLWGDDLNWVFGAVRGLHHPLTVLEVQQNFYRPIEQLYFAALLGLFGTWFPGWLGAALVVHLGCAALLWRLARELSGEVWCATVATGWWALHLLHVEPVARPYGIADPLALLGGLAAFELARRGRPLLAALPFALALGGKENALAIPLAIWLWALLAPGRRSRSWWLGTLPMAALSALSASQILLQRTASTSYLEIRPLVAVATFWENLVSWVGPDLHYVRHAVLGHEGPLLPWWVGLVLTAAAAAWLVRAPWAARLAGAWIVLLMAPTIFVPLQPARYHYAPLVGAALLLALAARRIADAGRPPRVIAAAALVASLIYNLVGIQLETADFRFAGDLHRHAAESLRANTLPAMLVQPDAVTVFLRPDDMGWIHAVRRHWDRHPWWAPVSYKLVFRRTAGILGLSNTWAFVTWAGYDLSGGRLFAAATPAEAVAAAERDRLLAVEHRASDNSFRLRSTMGLPPAAVLFADPDVFWALQPGRYSPDGTGTQYP